MTTDVLEKPKAEARLFRWGVGPRSSSPNVTEAHTEAAEKLEAAIARIAQFETSDELAAFLYGEGIRGQIGVSNNCPLAVWLRMQLGQPVRVSHTISIPHNGASTVIDCPAVAVTFYNRFDAGYYPALQMPDALGRVPQTINGPRVV